MFEKASALSHSIVMNHPFVDGNKRAAHAAMEIFLLLNGYEIEASIEDQEKFFLQLADGKISREKLADWIKKKAVSRKE